MDYGASELGSAAVDTGAASSVGSAASYLPSMETATAGTDIGSTFGTGGTLAGGTGEFATGVTAADVATPAASTAGTDLGLAGGTGGTLAGGTGEFSTGVTASDIAQSDPSLWSQITSMYNAASPYIDTAGKILQTGNMLKNAISGAGTPATGSANTPSPAPYTVSAPPSAMGGQQQQQTSQQKYIDQQTAYWQQLLSQAGSSLAQRPDIQDMIRRQASMYPA